MLRFSVWNTEVFLDRCAVFVADIVPIIDKIVTFDKLIERIKEDEEG